MPKRTEVGIGSIYNNLTILREVEPYISPVGHKLRRVECQCFCGKVILPTLSDVKRGHTKSCGCTNPGTTTHNLRYHPINRIWNSMKQRCCNSNNEKYKNYGERGITVCNEWLDFQNFYNWSIANNWSERLTIDRINNDGDYEPSNCRWISISENSRFKSTTKMDWQKVKEIRALYSKGKISYSQLAKQFGVTKTTIYGIIKEKIWRTAGYINFNTMRYISNEV